MSHLLASKHQLLMLDRQILISYIESLALHWPYRIEGKAPILPVLRDAPSEHRPVAGKIPLTYHTTVLKISEANQESEHRHLQQQPQRLILLNEPLRHVLRNLVQHGGPAT